MNSSQVFPPPFPQVLPPPRNVPHSPLHHAPSSQPSRSQMCPIRSRDLPPQPQKNFQSPEAFTFSPATCSPTTFDAIQLAALLEGRDHVWCIFVQMPVLYPRSWPINTWLIVRPAFPALAGRMSVPITCEPPPALPSETLPKDNISPGSQRGLGDTWNYFKAILWVRSWKLVELSDQIVLLRKKILSIF